MIGPIEGGPAGGLLQCGGTQLLAALERGARDDPLGVQQAVQQGVRVASTLGW